MSTLEDTVAKLAQRVQALEDELAIHRVIVQYGFAVDTGEADATAALYTEDTIFNVDGGFIMKGRQAVRDMVLGDNHQALLPNAAHAIGPAVVKLNGDKATATGYTRIYHKEGDNIRLFRLAFNHWEMERHDGRWLIAHRTARMVGHEESASVLRKGLP